MANDKDDDNVLALISPVRKATKNAVVDILEEALERAKAGKIVAIAIAEVSEDRGTGTSYTCDSYWAPLLGALSYLVHRVQLGWDDNA